VGGAFKQQRAPAQRAPVPSPPLRIAAKEVPGSPWRVGQNVVHPTFGAGVIVGAEGRGPEARVQVNFRKAGLKWLLLDYAKLIPA